jgi:hypothetical protein
MSEAHVLTPAPAKKRSSRRRWLFVAAFGLLPVFLLAGVYFTVGYLADVELQDALAEADRLDPGWRLDELLARRPEYTDDDNSAVQMLRVQSLIPSGWASKKEFNDLFEDLPRPHQLDTVQVKALREELAKAATAVTEARKLADLPHGRFPLEWTPDMFHTVLNSRVARDVAILLQFDVLSQAQEGDIDGALRSTRGIMNTGRSIGDEPLLISQLMRIGCWARALGCLERVLAQGEPPPEALADFQRLLEEDEAENLPLSGVRGERAGLDRLMANLENGTVRVGEFVGPQGLGLTQGEALEITLLSSASSSRKYQRAAMLRLMTRVVEMAKLPPEQQPQLQDQIVAETRNQHLLVRLLLPALTKISQQGNQINLALLRCAIAATAAERYRRAHGRWPASLDGLVADGLLKQVPTDPNDGAPLRYQLRKDRVVIYSVGMDLEDNGGTFDNRSGWSKGTDIGFTLWNVTQRRLLPLPAAEPPAAPPGQPGEGPDAGAAPPPGTKEPNP